MRTFRQAIHKARLQPRFPHPVRDRLAATMDQNRVDPDGFEEHDIAEETLHDSFILHGAAAILDDEQLSTELLNERKRFDQGFSACSG
jgi:hypothetical protein